MLFLLVTKYLMPYLKENEERDSEAQEKYEKELKEASLISYVRQWAVGSLLGLPRAARGQLRETLWWANPNPDPNPDHDEFPWLWSIFSPICGPCCVVGTLFEGGGFTGMFEALLNSNDVMKVRTQTITLSSSSFLSPPPPPTPLRPSHSPQCPHLR